MGLIAKLRHCVSLRTLLDIHQSLIVPYIAYGLSVWGQACKSYLHKILILQNVHYASCTLPRKMSILFRCLLTLTSYPCLNFLYYETLSELMYDVRNASAPLNVCNLFTHTSSIHSYNTRSSTSNDFYIKRSRLEIQKKNAFSRIDVKLWNEIPCSSRKLPKASLKKKNSKYTTEYF